MRRISVLLVVVVGLVTCCLVGSAAGQSDNGGAGGGKRRDQPDLAISYEGLVRLLRDNRGNAVAEAFVAGLVRLYGIAFHAKQEQLTSLKAAGATDALITEVTRAPVHIRTPPPPRDGFLTVACAPVDCRVQVNGRAVGTTSNGQLAQIVVPEGVAKVSVARRDYVSDAGEMETTIAPQKVTTAQFLLVPDKAALQARGADQFARMIRALGGETASATDSTRRCKGIIRVREKDGDVSTWTVEVAVGPPNTFTYLLRQGRQKYTLTLTGAGVKWKPRPKRSEDQILEDTVRLMSDFELQSVLARIADNRLAVMSHAAESEEQVESKVWARGDGKGYLFTLAATDRPLEVAFQSSGLDNGTRVLFTQYAEVNGQWFPKTMEIVRPGGKDGVEISFDSVEIVSAKKRKSKS